MNLSDLVQEISSLIQPSIPKTVRLQMDLDRNLPPIEADSSHVQQLIMNLVINGAESNGERPTGRVPGTTGRREAAGAKSPCALPATGTHPGRSVTREVK